MKHFLFSAVALMGMTLAMNGCSSDEDNSKASTLNGTTWVGQKNGTYTLKFAQKTFSLEYVYKDGDYSGRDKSEGTYVYQAPVVTFTHIDAKTKKSTTQTGKVEGDKLTIKGQELYILYLQK